MLRRPARGLVGGRLRGSARAARRAAARHVVAPRRATRAGEATMPWRPSAWSPALVALIEVLRARTSALIELPDGEQLVVEEVHDEPWWAFNYYLGELRSRVVVNTDQPTTASDLVTLAAHEAYPGHHTERAVKEQRLIRDRGMLEEAIQLVPTPQALVSEGIAEYRPRAHPRRRAETRARRGTCGRRASTPISSGPSRSAAPGDRSGRIGLDVALMIHEHDAIDRRGAGALRALGARAAGAGRPRRAIRDRPDLARVRDHVLGGQAPLQRVRRRRPGPLADAAHRTGPRRRPARRPA